MLNNIEVKEIKTPSCKLDELYIHFDEKFNLRTDEKFASLVNFSLHKDLKVCKNNKTSLLY